MPEKHPPLDRKKGLYLKDAGAKGLGVFCWHDLAAGAVLEVTPALILNDRETDYAEKTFLGNYIFTAGAFSKKLQRETGIKKHQDASCVIMGVMSFCNHAETPNAEVLWEEAGGALYHTLKTTRRIPKNTEICTSYGKGWFDDRK